MKEKFSRVRYSWHRIYITVLIVFLLCRDKLTSSRARVHWVGYHRRRPRPERPLFILLFLSAMVILTPHDFAYWAVLGGGTSSIFVVLTTIYLLIPRKQGHWIKNE